MDWALLFLKLVPVALMLLAVAGGVGMAFEIKRDLFMMKETKHRRELELLDKQIELERVLRMPLAIAPPDAVVPAPDTDTQPNGSPPLQNDVLIIG